MSTDRAVYPTWRTGLSVALLLAGLQAGLAAGAAAQVAGDADEGHKLVETWCSTCHVVGPSTQNGASTGAPTFAAVAQMKSTTPMSLHVFLQTPHARMPDLHLSRNEIDNIAAYIISLRTP